MVGTAGPGRNAGDQLSRNCIRPWPASLRTAKHVRGWSPREGAEVVGNTPKEFAEFMQRETVKWARVIKAAGIKLD